jgi:sugar lactone lactonase YvrE
MVFPMRWIGFIALIVLTVGGICMAENEGSVVALSDDFWKLVPKDAVLEKVASGLAFTEGPVWHRDGYLLFSDCHANGIMKWEPSTGKTTVYRKVHGFSNGQTFDKLGRLVTVEYGMHRIVRQEKDGTITPLVSEYKGKRLNSTNDLVVKSDGSI